MQKRELVESARAACIQNAEELLRAAKQLASPNSAHIAFHLATLALEEIGKSAMVFMSSLDEREASDRKRPLDWIDDHERKLFWALWSPQFDKELPWAGIQKALESAKLFHSTRLATLYVDPSDPDRPRNLSEGLLGNILQIAEARLEMEKLKKTRELTAEQKADLDWFMAATDDPQLRPIIFSKASFEKQAEFDNGQNPVGWVHWLRSEIEEANRISREITQKEMSRIPPQGEEAYEDKWEFTIRLKSWSHSIRAREFKTWNAGVDKIKLSSADKRELLVKFVAPKMLQLQMAWYSGQTTSNLFVIALNIGTTGFFWWYLPIFVSKYAERVMDIEQRTQVVIERVPQLTISWGNLVLSANDLNNVGIVFSHLARLDDPAKREPYTRYFSALALLAKNDIFFQFEPNILVEFYLVLRQALRLYGDWDGNDANLDNAIVKTFEALRAPEQFIGMIKDLKEAAELTKSGANKSRPITLDDVAKMKAVCDVYLNRKAREDMIGRTGTPVVS